MGTLSIRLVWNFWKSVIWAASRLRNLQKIVQTVEFRFACDVAGVTPVESKQQRMNADLLEKVLGSQTGPNMGL